MVFAGLLFVFVFPSWLDSFILFYFLIGFSYLFDLIFANFLNGFVTIAFLACAFQFLLSDTRFVFK